MKPIFAQSIRLSFFLFFFNLFQSYMNLWYVGDEIHGGFVGKVWDGVDIIINAISFPVRKLVWYGYDRFDDDGPYFLERLLIEPVLTLIYFFIIAFVCIFTFYCIKRKV